MRPILLGVPALLALTTACADFRDVDPLHAALADSSAAGYVVGDAANAGDTSAGAWRTGARRPTFASGDRDAGPIAQFSQATRDAGTDSPPRGAARDGSTIPADVALGSGATIVRDAGTGTGAVRKAPGDSAAGRGSDQVGPDIATLPALRSAPVADSIIVSGFLAYNAAARTVWLDLIAGANASNGALNYNGGFAGTQTLLVPVGWRVEARFVNRDADLSHSVTVVREVDPIPMMVPPAAFPGGFSIALEEGLAEGRTDAFRFSAGRAGRYMIMCAVPGHAQGGMWVWLEVSATARIPAHRRSPAP